MADFASRLAHTNEKDAHRGHRWTIANAQSFMAARLSALCQAGRFHVSGLLGLCVWLVGLTYDVIALTIAVLMPSCARKR